MNIPTNLKYDTQQHLWVRIENNVASFGITDYAQKKMGDILFVELGEEGTAFDKGEEFTVVESGKKAASLSVPFSCEVIEYNEILDDEPEAINDDAYEAWIMKASITDETGIKDLADADGYQAVVAE